MEGTLLLTGMSFLWEQYRNRGRELCSAAKSFRPMYASFLMLILYMVWEGASLAKGFRLGYFWEKNRVVLPMAVFAMMGLVYIKASPQKRLRTLLLSLTGAGLISAGEAILRAVLWEGRFSFYARRLSLRLDYNMFSQVVLMGLAAGLLLFENICRKKIFLCLLCAPVIALSSSRRNTVFMTALLAGQVGMELWQEKTHRKKLSCLGQWAALAAGIVVICLTGQSLLNQRTDILLEQGERGESFSAGAALERYLPEQKESPSKRRAIWKAAAKSFSDADTLDQFFGQGFGSDLELYKNTSNQELLSLYDREALNHLSAHSFLLADLINTGILGAGLGLLLWGLLGLKLLYCLFSRPVSEGMFLGFLYGTVFLCNLISNRWGFLYDKYFWMMLILLGSCRCQSLDRCGIMGQKET